MSALTMSFLLAAFLFLGVCNAQLNTAAKAAGLLYFGTATDTPSDSDSAYQAILANVSEFGEITPGNVMKWDTVQSTEAQFSFDKGDKIVAFAKKNDQLLRCHTLVWHNQLPSWVQSVSKEKVTAMLQDHVTKEVTHFKGKCYAWDVVNEALDENGKLRSDAPFNQIGDGEEYIKIAFEAAAKADPDVKLYYNDFNIENGGAKTQGALDIVKKLKAGGTKIDGVGIQGHMIVGKCPSKSTIMKSLQGFVDLGLEVAITELDIRMTLPATAQQLAQQKIDYRNVVAACVGVKGCVGITAWDFSDKYSWVPSVFNGMGAANLFDENFNRKPAYYGALAGLGGGNGTNSTTSGKDKGKSPPPDLTPPPSSNNPPSNTPSYTPPSSPPPSSQPPSSQPPSSQPPSYPPPSNEPPSNPTPSNPTPSNPNPNNPTPSNPPHHHSQGHHKHKNGTHHHSHKPHHHRPHKPQHSGTPIPPTDQGPSTHPGDNPKGTPTETPRPYTSGLPHHHSHKPHHKPSSDKPPSLPPNNPGPSTDPPSSGGNPTPPPMTPPTMPPPPSSTPPSTSDPTTPPPPKGSGDVKGSDFDPPAGPGPQRRFRRMVF